jgi:hypothetical protein
MPKTIENKGSKHSGEKISPTLTFSSICTSAESAAQITRSVVYTSIQREPSKA